MFKSSLLQRVLAFCAVIALVAGGSLSLAAPASALGKWHVWHFSTRVNGNMAASPAIEPLAKVMMRCNDATGQWSASATGIQPIESDGLTAWPVLGGTFWLPIGSNFHQWSQFRLTQDLKTGLFDARDNSVLEGYNLDPADCQTGVVIGVEGGYADDALFFEGTLP